MPTKMNSKLFSELKKTKTYQELQSKRMEDGEDFDPFVLTDDCDYILHIAARSGDYRAVELLLEAGMDVNILGDMDYTALHYAKWGGHENIVQLLLAHDASTTLRNAFGTLPLDETP